jgi:bifunctional UDP-N-acetylglucosamine pyrophosphorylase / glucosamine-1-phosphate N-acetyltransferase
MFRFMNNNTSNFQNVAAVVLAAGKGTRFKKKPDGLNKVSLSLNGKPIITYSVENLKKVGFGQIIVVVGHASDSVKKALENEVDYAVQEKQLGTGHAVESSLSCLNPNIEYVLAVNGDDSAFYTSNVFRRMIEAAFDPDYAYSFLTVIKKNPFGLGRIIRDENDEIMAVVEEKNATDKQRKIKEVNLGCYCFGRDFLQKHIGQIKADSIKGERYITDMVEIAIKNGFRVKAVKLENEDLWQGVNNEEELESAIQKMSSKNE